MHCGQNLYKEDLIMTLFHKGLDGFGGLMATAVVFSILIILYLLGWL